MQISESTEQLTAAAMPAYSKILVSLNHLSRELSIGPLTKEKNGANLGARSLSAMMKVVP